MRPVPQYANGPATRKSRAAAIDYNAEATGEYVLENSQFAGLTIHAGSRGEPVTFVALNDLSITTTNGLLLGPPLGLLTTRGVCAL